MITAAARRSVRFSRQIGQDFPRKAANTDLSANFSPLFRRQYFSAIDTFPRRDDEVAVEDGDGGGSRMTGEFLFAPVMGFVR